MFLLLGCSDADSMVGVRLTFAFAKPYPYASTTV